MHETAYENNLKKIQYAHKKLLEVGEKIQKYDAELKMSAAEAEIAKLAETFDLNVTTEFGQIEDVIQRKIDQTSAARRGSPPTCQQEGRRRDQGGGAGARR